MAPSGEWHPDFDPVTELEMLREFSLRLLARYPQYAVRLVVLEPGYMHVTIIEAEPFASVLIALNSDDRTNWYYEYSLAREDAGDFELRFRPDGIDSALDELHRSLADRPVRGRP